MLTLLTKRKEFSYEDELRLLYCIEANGNPAPNVYQYSVDPNVLFDEVVLDPGTDDVEMSTEVNEMRQAGFNNPIRRSDLYQQYMNIIQIPGLIYGSMGYLCSYHRTMSQIKDIKITDTKPSANELAGFAEVRRKSTIVKGQSHGKSEFGRLMSIHSNRLCPNLTHDTKGYSRGITSAIRLHPSSILPMNVEADFIKVELDSRLNKQGGDNVPAVA